MPKDPSDTDVGEHEVTQSSEPSEKQMTPQQLWLEKIQNPNPKFANASEAKEPKTYKEVSQNTAWQPAMEEEFITLEHNQTWKPVPRLRDIKPISCKWVYKIMCL